MEEHIYQKFAKTIIRTKLPYLSRDVEFDDLVSEAVLRLLEYGYRARTKAYQVRIVRTAVLRYTGLRCNKNIREGDSIQIWEDGFEEGQRAITNNGQLRTLRCTLAKPRESYNPAQLAEQCDQIGWLLKRAKEVLTTQQLIVLTRYYLQEESISDIARSLETNHETTRERLWRSVELLKEGVKECF